ncbi:DinB family protein [Paenibacillus piri]|uniref:Damage-inducible protein DinB n=1 Tax=Paenibacillus piri TaxID=2547395 RepID=A0A4V2ZS70_9BACL|nr:DinB family protein [Paenibacillus piri]TDF92124.1 hypothetical protein E1757_30455 [Paenibacillus piri]
MFKTVSEFESTWKQEFAATRRVMERLTDASLNQTVTAEHRSLGQLAWHLVITLHEMLSRTGLEFAAPADDAPAPASAAAIAEAYRQVGAAMLDAVQSQWTDSDLARVVNLYGEDWPNGLTLHLLILHQAHHRGQMTVLMRQAGLRVPDFYGPTREDWIERGMQPLV